MHHDKLKTTCREWSKVENDDDIESGWRLSIRSCIKNAVMEGQIDGMVTHVIYRREFSWLKVALRMLPPEHYNSLNVCGGID